MVQMVPCSVVALAGERPRFRRGKIFEQQLLSPVSGLEFVHSTVTKTRFASVVPEAISNSSRYLVSVSGCMCCSDSVGGLCTVGARACRVHVQKHMYHTTPIHPYKPWGSYFSVFCREILTHFACFRVFLPRVLSGVLSVLRVACFRCSDDGLNLPSKGSRTGCRRKNQGSWYTECGRASNRDCQVCAAHEWQDPCAD